MKNVYAQRLAAATALAMLTAGVPAMAERNSPINQNINNSVTETSTGGTLLLAQAEAAGGAPLAEGEETERQKRQRERREAQQQRQQEKQEAQEQRQQQRQERRKQQQEEARPAQAAEPAQPATPAEPAQPGVKSAQPAEPAQPAQPAAENPTRAERQKAREERQKAREARQEERKKQVQQAEQPAPPPGAPAPDQPAPAPGAPAPEQLGTTPGAPAPNQLGTTPGAPAPQEAQQPAPKAETPAERAKRQLERRQAREKQQTGNQQIDPERAGQPIVPVLPGSDTPVLDSQKQPTTPGEGGEQTAQPTTPPKPAGPPPTSDKDAQKETVKVEDIKPVTKEEGKRVEGERPPRRERREGSDVLREIDGRIIINLGGRPVVESSDRPRMERNAREVYYEELPRGRTRETIVRPNGVQIVTVRDRYGEVIRRSRITPDGREYVLVYVDEERRGPRDGRWRDPGADLPPLVLTIPVDEYILDAEDAGSDEDYYDFLDQPPVERVERLYSVDEVKRSARVRDTVRRVDLDTITFEFGSAEIKEDAISRLDNVAKAMERMLKENPAETFLIEGHTDAVGSDLANLALSDRRAEAVAAALTDVFEIPPENLTTQGYGEQYLKVKTESPDERNRRVAIRRITPLVSPVASAQ